MRFPGDSGQEVNIEAVNRRAAGAMQQLALRIDLADHALGMSLYSIIPQRLSIVAKTPIFSSA